MVDSALSTLAGGSCRGMKYEDESLETAQSLIIIFFLLFHTRNSFEPEKF